MSQSTACSYEMYDTYIRVIIRICTIVWQRYIKIKKLLQVKKQQIKRFLLTLTKSFLTV